MTAPRNKRQFAGAASDPAQRQITSFFGKAGHTSSSNVSSSSGKSSAPTLPANVQSSLINVGMRVRKSVPEGYKTGSQYGGFNLWVDNNKGPVNNSGVNSSTPAMERPSSSGQRELLPFCEINSVGGLASQTNFPSLHIPAGNARSSVPRIDDVPSLTSSQASVGSNASSAMFPARLPLTNRKRNYDEDDLSDTPSISDCLQVRRSEWLDGEVSPRSFTPVGWENARMMATPRKSRRKGGVPAVAVAGVTALREDQENMIMDDFEDASFLDYQALEADMDMTDI